MLHQQEFFLKKNLVFLILYSGYKGLLSCISLYHCDMTDCEWKAQAGNVCVASFDWSCSGICKSVEKLKFVHERCGEGDEALWSALL